MSEAWWREFRIHLSSSPRSGSTLRDRLSWASSSPKDAIVVDKWTLGTPLGRQRRLGGETDHVGTRHAVTNRLE